MELGGTYTLTWSAIVDLRRSCEVVFLHHPISARAAVGEALRSPYGLPACLPNEKGDDSIRIEEKNRGRYGTLRISGDGEV